MAITPKKQIDRFSVEGINEFKVNQTTHGFNIGEPVYWDKDNTEYRIGDLDVSGGTADFVVVGSIDANNFIISSSGIWDLDLSGTSGAVLGTTLVAGNIYYVSTSNSITNSDSSLSASNPIYEVTAVSGTTATVNLLVNQRPIAVNSVGNSACVIVYDYLNGFAASQTDIAFFESSGFLQQVVMPGSGSLVKASLQTDNARTAGTLTAEPTINGTKVTTSALDTILDATNTTSDTASVSPGTANLTFSLGDGIGVKVTSDGSWANSSGNIQIRLYVVFD